MASKVAAAVTAMAEPVCRELGLELVDVDYAKEGSRYMLRIFIDKPGGITIDDCELFSRTIDPVLDAADPVPGSYYLEVSSPGLDRPLRKEADFRRFAGAKISIRTFSPIVGSPIGGSRHLQGTLLGFDNGNVLLQQETTELAIPLDQVAKANLIPEL